MRLKAFADVGVLRFTGDVGVIQSMKWIDHAVGMVGMLPSMTTEKAKWELLSHQMIWNALVC